MRFEGIKKKTTYLSIYKKKYIYTIRVEGIQNRHFKYEKKRKKIKNILNTHFIRLQSIRGDSKYPV